MNYRGSSWQKIDFHVHTPVTIEHINSERTFIMDKRGEGIPIILEASKFLSNKYPKYELIDNTELKLTIYATESEI
jgi:ATP-dependent DNA helicase RecG